MGHPEIPAPSWQTALRHMLPLLVVRVCAKQFHTRATKRAAGITQPAQ